MMPNSRSYKEDLIKILTDPIEVQAYLKAALDDDDPRVFLLAVQDVVDAQGGMTQLDEDLVDRLTLLEDLAWGQAALDALAQADPVGSDRFVAALKKLANAKT